jgi:hypothetical protein
LLIVPIVAAIKGRDLRWRPRQGSNLQPPT